MNKPDDIIMIEKPNRYQPIIDRWNRVMTISYGAHMTCGLLIEIYQCGKVFKGTIHVTAGDHGIGFGVPFMHHHEPGFDDAELTALFYLSKAYLHVKENGFRDEDKKMQTWIEDRMIEKTQLEIKL